MVDEQPWLDKKAFMAHTGRSERTIQNWAREGRAERQLIDGKAYYRTSQHPVAVQRPETRYDALRAMEMLREDIARLEAKIDALGGAQRATGLRTCSGAAPPRRGLLARLLGRGK